MINKTRIVIKGAGDIASGAAYRLWKAGFNIVMTELSHPLAIRRAVSFSEGIYSGIISIDGITAKKINQEAEIFTGWEEGWIPLLVDPKAEIINKIKPDVVVDAILAKRNTGTCLEDGLLVIGLGPGFSAGLDVHAVIETNRGHYLGRVYWEGAAQPDTGIPGNVSGLIYERVVYSPDSGVFAHEKIIGDIVNTGDLLGFVNDTPIRAQISGVVRGLIHDDIFVQKGMKIGDIDPRGIIDHCWTISEKALAVGGGVLEAVLTWMNPRIVNNK